MLCHTLKERWSEEHSKIWALASGRGPPLQCCKICKESSTFIIFFFCSEMIVRIRILSRSMLIIMAIFLYGYKAILNVSCPIFSYLSWLILRFLAAVSSTVGLFLQSLSHKPVRFALPGLASGTNHLDEWLKLTLLTHTKPHNVFDWQAVVWRNIIDCI